MFRRRRDAGQHRSRPAGRPDPAFDEQDEAGEPGEEPDDGSYPRYPDEQAAASERDGAPAGEVTGSGPWDAAGRYPQRQRVELGSLQIPVVEGWEVQLNVADEQIVAVTVGQGSNSMQVQAFAAPKSGGLWDDVRVEIAEEISKLGGESAEAQGPFGPELQARVPADPATGSNEPQPARFIGVDGPRWMLRGVLKGQAAANAELAGPLEEVFADIVVVRGDHPAVPRELLPIQLPAEMREAIEQEMAEQAEQEQYPNPFERGPEITETR